MSLVPLLFSDWWEDLDRPHRIFDQHFGMPLSVEDLLDIAPSPRSELVVFKPDRHRFRSASRYHPFLQSLAKRGRGSSTVSNDKDNFQVTLDVQQFLPEEINVKVVDNSVVIEAKHEEKKDEHGYISRQFSRRYLIPEQCEIEKLESCLSSDGVLKITAPKKEVPKADSNERIIKVQLTGEPAIADKSVAGGSSQSPKETNQPQQGAQRTRKSTVKAA